MASAAVENRRVSQMETENYNLTKIMDDTSQLRARRKTLTLGQSERQILAAGFSYRVSITPHPHEISAAARVKVRERWRSIIRRVRLALGVMAGMADNSSLMAVRSAMEEQWHVLHTCRQTNKLTFNRAIFDRDRVRTMLPMWVHDLTRKPASQRTEVECRRLQTLLHGLKSFDNFSDKVQMTLCRTFYVLTVKTRRVILRKGHVPQNYYLIYSGSVFINIEMMTASGHHTSSTELVLSRGDAFGEKGLLEDSRRSATVTCREDCEMLVSDKDTFGVLCPRIFEKELEEKISFIRRLHLFSSKYWNDEALHQLCAQSQVIEYKINKVIVQDSTQNEWLYICMKGTCRILKCLVLTLSDDKIALIRPSLIPASAAKRTTPVQPYANEDSQEASDAESDSEVSSHSDNNKPVEKIQLLSVMGMQYVEQLDEKERIIYLHQKKKSVEAKSAREDVGPPIIEGAISLNQLMTDRAEKLGLHGERLPFIYISTMKARETFDLPRIMGLYDTIYATNFRRFTRPSLILDEKGAYVPETGSLVLVSDGAKMLRIKKDVFLRLAKSSALEHARQLAFQSTYPPHDALVRAFVEAKQWEHYKHHLVSQVLRSASRQAVTNRHGKVPQRTPAMTSLSPPPTALPSAAGAAASNRPVSAAISMLSASDRCETPSASKFLNTIARRPVSAFHRSRYDHAIISSGISRPATAIAPGHKSGHHGTKTMPQSHVLSLAERAGRTDTSPDD